MSDLGSQADSPNNLEQSVALIIEMQYDPALAIGTERAASHIIALVLEEAVARAHEYCFRTSTASYIEPVAVRNAAPYIEAAIRSLALPTEAVRDD